MSFKYIFLTVLFSFTFVISKAQLLAGPMLGYSEMKEVAVWVQTMKSQKVKIAYWEIGKSTKKHYSEEKTTSKFNAFCVTLIADQLEPGLKYNYEVYIDSKKMKFSYPLVFQTQTLWHFRSDPPDFKFAVGSCVYTNEPKYDRPGSPYGQKLSIFEKINAKKPNFMVWGGDNIYFREVDWSTKAGMQHRYTEFKRKKELQPLWANVHHYAIWDDHDYGNNDSDRSFWAKNLSLAEFKNFWANPRYTYNNEAITGTFFWEDCQFFLMDNRWFRAPNNLQDDKKDYYGEKQLQWLIDALVSSTAPFKFIITGGQVVNDAKIFENMSNYPAERQKLFDLIALNKIPGVVFISGDRHHTVLHKKNRESNYPIYDFTISPLTSKNAKPVDAEKNVPSIVPNTEVNDSQTFGLLEVSGKRENRVLKINVLDAEGKQKWEYTINANDLKTK